MLHVLFLVWGDWICSHLHATCIFFSFCLFCFVSCEIFSHSFFFFLIVLEKISILHSSYTLSPSLLKPLGPREEKNAPAQKEGNTLFMVYISASGAVHCVWCLTRAARFGVFLFPPPLRVFFFSSFSTEQTTRIKK